MASDRKEYSLTKTKRDFPGRTSETLRIEGTQEIQGGYQGSRNQKY